jgi:hypothetical protein
LTPVVALKNGNSFPRNQQLEAEMKMISKVLTVTAITILMPVLTSLGEPAKHREITAWKASSTGSHIGSGYASTYLTNIRAKTTGQDTAQLRRAIDSLDGLGMIQVRGFGLLPAAVAWQSQTSIHELVTEQAATGLSYGELLMAHTLASESKRDLQQVITLRTKTRSWGQLAEQLGVSPEVIVVRTGLASDRIRLADARTRQHGPGDPSLQGTRPSLHHYSALH